MTPIQFASYVRWKTKTDSSSFTDAEMLVVMNIIKDEIAAEILKADENYFGFQLFGNLTANKRNYAFDTEMLSKMDYLEAKLDGTTWKVLKEYTLQQLQITTVEADIISGMAGKKPGFTIYGGEILLLSDTAIIDVSQGIKLWSRLYPADIVSLSGSNDMSIRPSVDSDGFPRQFHKLWATKVIVEYKNSQEKPIPLNETERNYDNDLIKAIDSLKNLNQDRSIVPTAPYDDGQDY